MRHLVLAATLLFLCRAQEPCTTRVQGHFESLNVVDLLLIIVAGMPLLEHAPSLQASPVDTALVYGSAGGRGGFARAQSHSLQCFCMVCTHNTLAS